MSTPSWGADAPPLNPTQALTLERIGAPKSERPVFPTALAARLRAELFDRLGPLDGLLSETLFVNKYAIHQAFGCEVRPTDDFEWTPARARGTVSHHAIELSVMRRDQPTPLELVDDAIASLIHQQRSLGEWLGKQTESTLALVRAEANAIVVGFGETWPPLKREWTPVVEGTLAADFGQIRLSGRPDLTLGRADGDRAAKVIVDFKTGRPAPNHVDDLRFYALVDTLRVGTPPRLLVSSYLDSGSLVVEEVTEGLLWASVDRVADALARIVTLRVGEREPELRGGPACRWCPIVDECSEGRRFLDADDEEWFDDDPEP